MGGRLNGRNSRYFTEPIKNCYTLSMNIQLSNTDDYAVIDDEDFEKVIAFGKWYKNDSGYAVKKTRINGKNVSIRMHALINDTPKGWHTDHINGNRLDNRKSNLRTVTAQVNAWNRHKAKDKRKYPDLPAGITWDISRKKYLATKTLRRRFNTLQEAKNFVAESENIL